MPVDEMPFPNCPYACDPQQYALLFEVVAHATLSPTARLVIASGPAMRSGMSVHCVAPGVRSLKHAVSFATPSKSPLPKQ